MDLGILICILKEYLVSHHEGTSISSAAWPVHPVAKWDNAFSFCSRHPLLGGSDLIGAVCVKYYEPLNVFKFYVSSFHNNSTQYIVRGVTPKPPTKKQTKNGAINIRSAVCKGLNKKDVYLCLYVTQDISLKYLLYYNGYTTIPFLYFRVLEIHQQIG